MLRWTQDWTNINHYMTSLRERATRETVRTPQLALSSHFLQYKDPLCNLKMRDL